MLRQQSGLTQPGQQPKITVQFSVIAEQDMSESEKQGRPVFKEVEYITKYIPGDKDNVIHRPIRYMDKAEFPDAYKAFQMNKEQIVEGTPLEMLPFMGKAQIAELSYYGVKTAEQIVNMADVNGQRIMGFQQLKQKAKSYLDAVAGAAPAVRLQAELEKRDEEIALLKKMVEEQGKRMEDLSKRGKNS